jgi:dTDP-4-amino-4,6-dideoxygalactose transaminase
MNKVPFNDLSRIHQPLELDFVRKVQGIVADSSFVLGHEVKDFEESCALSEGSRYCVGVDNGTNAIELMLRAAGIQKNDEVITSAMTFIATVFAIERIGAKAILVDTLPDSPLMDFTKIEEHITKKSKAILLVTLHGRVEHLKSYSEVAQRNGLALLIDGAQSHLSRYEDEPLTKFATAVSTSFYPGKNLGSLGEGGAILTDQPEIEEKVKLFRDWGAKKKYHHDYWGGNFRLHAIQAAFLSLKLPLLGSWTEERKSIAEKYRAEIAPELIRPQVEINGDHVYHVFDLNVENREKAIETFDKNKVSWGIHYPKIVSDNLAYSHLATKDFVNARKFAASTFSIPLFPSMTEAETTRVIEVSNQIGRHL